MRLYLADLPAHQAVELLSVVRILLVRHKIGQVKSLAGEGDVADLQALISALEAHRKLTRADLSALIRLLEASTQSSRLTLSTNTPELGKTIAQALGTDSQIDLQESTDIGITLQ